MKNLLAAAALLASLIIITGCNKGIEPEPERVVPPGETGFSGKITFEGSWPPGVTRTHLFVFKNAIQSAADFSFLNLSAVIDPVPYGSTQFNYDSIEMNYIEHAFLPEFKIQPGEHRYVIVAQSNNPEISFARGDWVIVGVYCIGGDQSKPRSLICNEGSITAGVDINVNFNNPPPQPPL
ncbi:MAG: hypothetical protein CVV24_00745 [Ignavibacteriae bacterium HGW-Ignavibacteriae-3]|nr:MAG: hypothetical protein CVV24_00745 [Ignavibacteriae bacterium HGW-Ignavibacteriae-3]